MLGRCGAVVPWAVHGACPACQGAVLHCGRVPLAEGLCAVRQWPCPAPGRQALEGCRHLGSQAWPAALWLARASSVFCVWSQAVARSAGCPVLSWFGGLARGDTAACARLGWPLHACQDFGRLLLKAACTYPPRPRAIQQVVPPAPQRDVSARRRWVDACPKLPTGGHVGYTSCRYLCRWWVTRQVGR